MKVQVREYDRDRPLLFNDAEFFAPSWCPHCGTKLDMEQEYWFTRDGRMLMTECPSCHTHFGVAGRY